MTDERIYMAGPVQHADDYGVGWRQMIKQEYPDRFDWADPLDVYHAGDMGVEREWTDEEIIVKDLRMIDESDGVLVGWDDVPSAGTPMEVFYASFVRNIPVVVRYDGDEISPWMSGHSMAIMSTWDAAVQVLGAIFDGDHEVGDPDAVPYQYDAARDIARIQDIVEESEDR